MKVFDNVKLFFLTKRAQKIILDKVKSTNGYAIHDINEIFNVIKSEIVEENPMLSGSYHTTLQKIEYYGDEHVNIHVAVHENLHAASREKNHAHVTDFPYISHNIGFEKDENFFIEHQKRMYTESLCYGQSINEAFNEYFTLLLLKKHNIKPFEDSYLETRAIISPFFYKWNKKGEILFDDDMANKMFSLYINSNINGLLELLTNEYFTTRSKVLKLVLEMDMLGNAQVHNDFYEAREWLGRCMQTVFDIHFDKYHHNHPKRTKADFINRHNSRVIFPIGDSQLIKESIQIAKINFLSEPKIRKNNEYVDFDRFLINVLFDANSNNVIAKSKAQSSNSMSIISRLMPFNADYMSEIKGFSGIEKLDLILFCANMQSFKNAKLYHNFLNRIVPVIAKNGMPKHRDARNQAMYYLLNLPAYRFAGAYKYFSPKEIVEYINNDKQHISMNMRNLKSNMALRNYLQDDINDLKM